LNYATFTTNLLCGVGGWVENWSRVWNYESKLCNRSYSIMLTNRWVNNCLRLNLSKDQSLPFPRPLYSQIVPTPRFIDSVNDKGITRSVF